MSPASIFATKFAQAKASISQRATVRRVRMTRWSPSSMPPYPAQSPRCVMDEEVSTLLFLQRLLLLPVLQQPGRLLACPHMGRQRLVAEARTPGAILLAP